MRCSLIINKGMKQFLIAVILTSILAVCLVDIIFPLKQKQIITKSTDECVDNLLVRYQEGYFTAARHSVSPVSMAEDSEKIRLRNRVLELQHENNILRQEQQIEEERIEYIIKLLETEKGLLQAKSEIKVHDREAHAAIDRLLSWIRNELHNHKVDTELDELLIRKHMELRNDEEHNDN